MFHRKKYLATAIVAAGLAASSRVSGPARRFRRRLAAPEAALRATLSR